MLLFAVLASFVSASPPPRIAEIPPPEVAPLVDALEPRARARPDPQLQFDALSRLALYRGFLNQTEASARLWDEVEAHATAMKDPLERIRTWQRLGVMAAAVDLPRARRWLVTAEADVTALPADRRRDVPSFAHFHHCLGDYRRAVDVRIQALQIDPNREMHMAGYQAVRLRFEGRDDLHRDLCEIVRKATVPANKTNDQFALESLESNRVQALADAGLLDDAQAVYDSYFSKDNPDLALFGGLPKLVTAYARAGRMDKARELIAAHVDRIHSDRRWLLITPAANAGNYELAESLTIGPGGHLIHELRSVMLIAHHAGHTAVRDRLFERWRTALTNASKSWPPGTVNAELQVATTEVMLGRYEPALRLIPQRPTDEGYSLHEQLVIELFKRRNQRLQNYDRWTND